MTAFVESFQLRHPKRCLQFRSVAANDVINIRMRKSSAPAKKFPPLHPRSKTAVVKEDEQLYLVRKTGQWPDKRVSTSQAERQACCGRDCRGDIRSGNHDNRFFGQ